MVAPVSAIPVGAVVVKVPPQTVADAFATVSPVGIVSVNATPVSETVFAPGLVMVNVNEVVVLNAIAAGLNALAIDGGATTARLAEAVPPVPPCVEVIFPVVLFCSPTAIPVTFTERVHELLCAKFAPLRLITLVPCVAVSVPQPHIPLSPLGELGAEQLVHSLGERDGNRCRAAEQYNRKYYFNAGRYGRDSFRQSRGGGSAVDRQGIQPSGDCLEHYHLIDIHHH